MNNQSNKKSENAFLVQGSILAIASIISRIVGLLYRVPMTAIIGKRGNDFYGTAFELYNIILIISSYSIPLAVSKLVAARMAKGHVKNANRVLKGSLVFASITGGTAALVMFFGADFFTGSLLKTPMSNIALRVLSPVLFIVAIVGVFRGFFQGLNTMLPSAISQIAEQIVNAIVSVAAAYVLFDYGARIGKQVGDSALYAAAYGAAGGTLGTAMGAVAAFIVVFIIYLMYRRRFRGMIEREHSHRSDESYSRITKILIITIIPVLLSTTLYNISGILDQGLFKNIAAAQNYDQSLVSEWWGVFTGQYRVLINVPISIASAMAASSVPSLTSAFHAGETESVKRKVRSATRFIMVIAFPCTIGMAVLSRPIMILLFNDPDQTSANMLIVGAISILFYSLSTLSNGLLQGIDRLNIPVRNAAIALVAQAGFLVVMMKAFHLHIYAVILANAFYAFMMCLLNGIALAKYSGAKQDPMKTYVIPCGASVVMGIAVFLVYNGIMYVLPSNTVATIVSIAVGMIVYFVVIVLAKGISEEDMLGFPKGHLLVKAAKALRLI